MYKIVGSPSNFHAESNKIFINSEQNEIPKFVLIDKYIFSCEIEQSIEYNDVSLNLIIRNLLNINNGQMIDICNINPPKYKIMQSNLNIKKFRNNTRKIEIDYNKFISELKTKYDNQYFTEEQELLFVFENNKFIVKFESINFEDNTSQHGYLFNNTNLILLSEDLLIKFNGIPDNLLDEIHGEKELFNFNPFDLEKMGIGGLTEEFITLFRRAFITRLMPPSLMKKLKLKHVKGVLLHGPPGTGKTLIARKIGEMLNCKQPKIINGPEILNKFVGESERNIRALFADAEVEQNEKGDNSSLHLLIFDEFDSICKKRGLSGDNTGVGDNIVNQLLSKIDGVDALNNVLLIGMTNRKDLIDEAILRPGRFEVHISISLPDEKGRNEILRIHTNNMMENSMLDEDVDLNLLAERTRNFSGAELEGLVKSATSYALQRHSDQDNPSQLVNLDSMKIHQNDFLNALDDITPAFGNDIDEIFQNISGEIIDYGENWKYFDNSIKKYVNKFCENNTLSAFRLLLYGDTGCGKTTITKYISKLINYPYVKVIHPSLFIGYSETMKINSIKKIFMDAYQSSNSIIIIDDLERLIDFSDYGNRYSNPVLQTLLVLINQNTKKNNKLFIIGTCKNINIMKKLELFDIFDVDLHLSNISTESAKYICNCYKKDEIKFDKNMPIKWIINHLMIS